MKRAATMGFALLLAVFFLSCVPQASLKAGSATAESLLRLLPQATRGVVAVDVHRAVGLAPVPKMLENPQAKARYDEMVQVAGIDPMKDVYLVVLGLLDTPNALAQEGAVIINLKYDQEKLLAAMKSKAPEVQSESYNGVTIYSNIDGAGAKPSSRAAFLDGSNILLGSEAGVKGVIDVFQKKADGVAKNKDMGAILKSVDKRALAWGAFALPPELVRKGVESIPQLKVMEGVTALTMSFDYRLANYVADVRTKGGTEEQNKNLATALNGFKAMGAMMAAQEPAAGEFLNAVEVTSGADFVRLYISVSEEVMQKLGQAVQSRLGDYIKLKKDAAPEEKK